jgi:hypothetical protein
MNENLKPVAKDILKNLLSESETSFENVIGKFFIIKDLAFSDYMKDEQGKIKLYDTFEEATDVCGIYEFPNVLICEIKHNYIE